MGTIWKLFVRTPVFQKLILSLWGMPYLGYRIVGTSRNYLLIISGRLVENIRSNNQEEYFLKKAKEALVGAQVASELGLKLGDRFHPYHGLEYNPATKHEDIYLVVGILKPTGTLRGSGNMDSSQGCSDDGRT